MKSDENDFTWHETDLQDFLMSSLMTPESCPSTLFVDAMDECDETEVRAMVSFFRKLAKKAYQAGAVLRICLSSRYYPNISITGCPEVVVEQHNRMDILRYIDNEAEENYSIEALKVDLFEKSNVIFLWVVLVVALLKSSGHGKSLKWLRKKLEDIPSQLETLFRKIFDVTTEEQKAAIRLMHIILFSRRALGLSEIQLALAFSGHPYSSMEDWYNSAEYLETPHKVHAMIIDISRGLLERTSTSQALWNLSYKERWDLEHEDADIAHISHKRRYALESTSYQFIHETVREFFLSGEGFKLLGSDPTYGNNQAGPGHTTLATACVNYLNTAEFASLRAKSSSRTIYNKYPFLNYTAFVLLAHIEAAEENGSCLEALIALV